MATEPDLSVSPPNAELLHRVLDEANSLGRLGRLPFAAVVVSGTTILGTGVNTCEQTGDPLAHAEVEAIRDAATRHGSTVGAAVISSCEPCALCRVSAVAAGIDTVWYVTPKELIPAEFGSPDQVTLSLIDSVQGVLPSLVHPAAHLLAVDEKALAQPFREWLAVSRGVSESGTTGTGQ